MTSFLRKLVLDRRLMHTASSLSIYSPLPFQECLTGLFSELLVALKDTTRQR